MCVALQRRVVEGWVGQVSSILCNRAAFGGCVVQLCCSFVGQLLVLRPVIKSWVTPLEKIWGHQSPGKSGHIFLRNLIGIKKNAPDETRNLRNLLGSSQNRIFMQQAKLTLLKGPFVWIMITFNIPWFADSQGSVMY